MDFFYLMPGVKDPSRFYEAHLKLLIGGTPLVETHHTAVERIEAAGGIPRDGLPGKAAEAPKDDEGDAQVFSCGECNGPMSYRKGTSKAGKPYAGWFCQKRGCKGVPIWDDTD
jgi:hypothetical protein